MRWPIRNQILAPFTVILLGAIATIASSAAALAAARSERQTLAQLSQVIATLQQAQIPYTPTVLEKMRGLTGAHFIAVSPDGSVLESTLSHAVAWVAQVRQDTRSAGAPREFASFTLDDVRYFVAIVERNPGTDPALLVLFPETSVRQARWEAAWPPLLVGGVTAVLMFAAAAWIAQRFARRIERVRRQVAAVAAGEFREFSVGARSDEIQELVASVNSMCRQLQRMQETIRQTERAGLLGQLAGGIAHQLRNAVTGARLAVQVHLRRCPGPPGDDSLAVALKQLSLTEEQVKGFLALGRHERRPAERCAPGPLLADIVALTGPLREHAQIAFAAQVAADLPELMLDRDGVRSAVLNLLLNAIEAAGPGGRVELSAAAEGDAVVIEIRDNGPGPPAHLAAHLFDAFVTGKPEGVGLGLALARQVARDHGGRLEWSRDDRGTTFTLTLPLTA